MAALVTLTVAKSHLRITSSAEDAAITRTSEQASDIILSFLKGRRIVVYGITSVGALATVTTSGAHLLTTGNTVTFYGADQPEYNGVFTATVTSGTVFTIPITGSPASPATGTIGLNVVPSWTDATVPARVQAAVLMVLGHLWAFRGDEDMAVDEALWASIGRLLMRDRDPALA